MSTDLLIEQTLMRSMKATGGLTHGRGFAEAQRTQWLLSLPDCSSVKSAMQEVTGIHRETSCQHREATQAMQVRDNKDATTILSFLLQRNPFECDNLLNIATGVAADDLVNADIAREVGCRIIQKMEGKKAFDYSFKSKDKVINMEHKSCVKIDG